MMGSLLIRFKENKKGSFSMLFVIFLFIIVISIDFFVNYLIYNATQEELYGIINNSADSALKYSIDNVSHRQDQFDVSEYDLYNKFQDLVVLSINETSYVDINTVRDISINVRENDVVRLGSNQRRYQLRAIFSIEIDAPRLLSLTNQRSVTFDVEKRIVFSSST